MAEIKKAGTCLIPLVHNFEVGNVKYSETSIKRTPFKDLPKCLLNRGCQLKVCKNCAMFFND